LTNVNRLLIGQKIEDIAEKYFNNKNKKDLIGEFLKIIEIENSKRKKATAKESKIIAEKKKEVIKEVAVQVEEIRAEKKAKKVKVLVEKPRPILKVGDRVRMIDGKAVGTLDSIEKNKATVNYGLFTSKVSLDELELVEAVKK
jgi:DNA mismatch repair protein MutS2